MKIQLTGITAIQEKNAVYSISLWLYENKLKQGLSLAALPMNSPVTTDSEQSQTIKL